MRNEQTNLSYATPLVEIIEVEVEQGFAASNGFDPINPGGPF